MSIPSEGNSICSILAGTGALWFVGAAKFRESCLYLLPMQTMYDDEMEVVRASVQQVIPDMNVVADNERLIPQIRIMSTNDDSLHILLKSILGTKASHVRPLS